MAGFRGAVGGGRKNGDSHQPHPDVVHVYFLFNPGLSHYCVHDRRLLDEYEALHPGRPQESTEVSITENIATLRLKFLNAKSQSDAKPTPLI